MNGCARAEGFDPAAVKVTLNRWIVGETQRTAKAVTEALADCGYDAAAGTLYRFIWNVYCDWYVELAKPLLNGEDAAAKAETQATAAWTLDVILKLLHPVMPFITEELWAQTAGEGAPRTETGFLMSAAWPDLDDSLVDPVADAEIGRVIAAIEGGRSVKAELNVPGGARLSALEIVDADPATRRAFEANAAVVTTLLRVEALQFVDTPSAGSIPFMDGARTYALPVAAHIDVAAEKARLTKEVAARVSDIGHVMKKLGNPDFMARAKEEVIEENQERLAEAEAAKARLEGALARLEGMK